MTEGEPGTTPGSTPASPPHVTRRTPQSLASTTSQDTPQAQSIEREELFASIRSVLSALTSPLLGATGIQEEDSSDSNLDPLATTRPDLTTTTTASSTASATTTQVMTTSTTNPPASQELNLT